MLSVRRKVYRGVAGWSVCGRVSHDQPFSTRIFVRRRETALAVKQALVEGRDGEIGDILRGEVCDE